LQIAPRFFSEDPEERAGLYSGSSGFLSGGAESLGPFWSLSAAGRHFSEGGLGPFDVLSGLGKVQARLGDDGALGLDTFGFQNFSGDHWAGVIGDLQWKSPNFQTLDCRPYFQEARQGPQTLDEAGARLGYHFNLGGLAEAHLGGGWSSTWDPSSSFR